MLTGYQKKRIDSLISENKILILFTTLVARNWSFSRKNADFFCFHQNRLVGYQKKRIDSLNKDSTML